TAPRSWPARSRLIGPSCTDRPAPWRNSRQRAQMMRTARPRLKPPDLLLLPLALRAPLYRREDCRDGGPRFASHISAMAAQPRAASIFGLLASPSAAWVEAQFFQQRLIRSAPGHGTSVLVLEGLDRDETPFQLGNLVRHRLVRHGAK